MAVEVTSKNFKKEVLEAKEKVLVDFHAVWCGPCKMLAPVLSSLESEAQDFKICKVDIDKSPELAEQFHIMSVPTLMVMNKGKVEKTVSGVRPRQEILTMMSL